MTKKEEKYQQTNRQTIVHRTQHRELKTEQHEHHQKLVVILGVSAWKLSKSCSTYGTRRVAHFSTNHVRV